MAETKEKLKPTPDNSLSLSARVEALLFVASNSTSTKQLADSLGVSTQRINTAIDELQQTLANRGIRLQENKGRYQLTTAPEISEEVEFFLQLESTARFTAASLETLAIVAYQQPITRPGVDAIRGVNSDSVIRNLLSKGLIEEIGRSDGPGRPILYGTSPEFLQYFGLGSIKDLPEIEIKRTVDFLTDESSPAQHELPLDNHLLKE
ncbi:MAG: SMC-Scp complex subunit ScpB [Anaerolineales bacterium]|nr:SMC-Scp complex subunit ScpB [Anaerolineales bacterium]